MERDGRHPDPFGIHEHRYFVRGRATSLVHDAASGFRNELGVPPPPVPGGPTRDAPTARAPSGWHPDPAHPIQERYWSGNRWTGLLRAPDPSGLVHYTYFSEARAAHAPASARDGAQSGGNVPVGAVSPPSLNPGAPSTRDRPASGRVEVRPEPVGPDPDGWGLKTLAGVRIMTPVLGRRWIGAAAAAVVLTIGLVVVAGGTTPSPTTTRVTPPTTTTRPGPARRASTSTTLPAPHGSSKSVATPVTTPPPTGPPAPSTTVPTAAEAIPAFLAAPAASAHVPLTTSASSTTTETTTTTVPSPPTKTVLALDSGSGIGSTRLFTTTGSWSVLWAYDCTSHGAPGFFDFAGHTADGGVTSVYGPGQFGATGSGVEHYDNAGTLDLVVNSECSWAVLVATS